MTALTPRERELAALDALSRQRALTDAESRRLEQLVRTEDHPPIRPAEQVLG